MKKKHSTFVRIVLVLAGSLSLLLGILGIFLPILPTVPFLLLSAACYARSSQRFYHWLLSNRFVGKYIKDYREKRGLPRRSKIISISFLWISTIFSALFFVTFFLGRLLLFFIAVAVSFHIASLKTLKREETNIPNTCKDNSRSSA